MQPTSISRGYSDFFTSGYKAVTSRLSLHHSRSSSVPVTFPQIDITTSTRRSSSHRSPTTKKSNLKARPASMFVSSQLPELPESRENTRRRRSSIVTLSSRLYNRVLASSTTTREPSSRLIIKNWSKRNSSSEDALSELPDVWLAPSDSCTPTCQNGSSLFTSIDPFSSSPDSISFFIELTGTPSTPNHKRESFLSFTSSSPETSFLHLPLPPRHERPLPIQTTPLPSHSRGSSFLFLPIQDKSDTYQLLPEEDLSSAAESITEDYEEWNDPAKIDWHQFHLLLED